jgi:hypothetical protein
MPEEVLDARYMRAGGREGVHYSVGEEGREVYTFFTSEPRLHTREGSPARGRECEAWGMLSDDWIRRMSESGLRNLHDVYLYCGDDRNMERLHRLRPEFRRW